MPTLVPSKVANEDLISDRRGKIVDAAMELFLKQGFHKTSVREIATNANITMGALYLYIARKEDVLYLISDSIMSEFAAGMRTVEPRETCAETLRAQAEYFFGAVERLSRQLLLLYRESASLDGAQRQALKDSEIHVRTEFARVIRSGVAGGEFRDVDPEFVAQNILMLAHMWALKGWALRDRMDFETFRDAQINLIFSMLTPTPR
ncbi:MAG: TetR/AcrR family transcriptional regulator [Dehalococcoidia bacterium]|nr:TetR/AcrR family transcriptional regulator [Dehalococcoidia bacterium]